MIDKVDENLYLIDRTQNRNNRFRYFPNVQSCLSLIDQYQVFMDVFMDRNLCIRHQRKLFY